MADSGWEWREQHSSGTKTRGVLEEGFKKMRSSLICSALSAICTAGSNILGYCLFSRAWHLILQRPPLLKNLFLGSWKSLLGRTRRGSYSRKGVFLPSECLLETPYLEPSSWEPFSKPFVLVKPIARHLQTALLSLAKRLRSNRRP